MGYRLSNGVVTQCILFTYSGGLHCGAMGTIVTDHYSSYSELKSCSEFKGYSELFTIGTDCGIVTRDRRDAVSNEDRPQELDVAIGSRPGQGALSLG